MKRIVLLIGPSSVGKTTLCRELKNSYDWTMINQDDLRDSLNLGDKNERNKSEHIFRESVREELQRQNLFSELADFMPEDDVLKLCLSGELTLTVGQHQKPNDARVIHHQFESPYFKNIDELKTTLQEAGLNQQGIHFLVVRLRLVGRAIHQVPDPVLTEAIEQGLASSTSCIIDAIPTEGGVAAINRYLKKELDKYLKNHPTEEIQTFTVLAYCSPQDLSNRVKTRNQNAVLMNDLSDLREGVGPFNQLGSLVGTSGANIEDIKIGEVSKDDLFKIAYDHPKRVNIHLVSVVPEKMTEGEYYLIKDIAKNTWSLQYQKKSQVHVISSSAFQNREDLKDLNAIMDKFDKVLAGRAPEELPFNEFIKNVAKIREVILNFNANSEESKFSSAAIAALESVSLSKQFGLPKVTESSQNVGLFARAKDFDFLVDTTSGNPSAHSLAETFFEEIAKIESKREVVNSLSKRL